MRKERTYQLHIDGQPQEHRARMTDAEAERTNETLARFGNRYHATGEPLGRTRFTVRNLDGTRQEFSGFAAYNAFLRNGGMDAYRRRSVEYKSTIDKPVRRVA
jgi:hypothetical protein